MPSTEVSRRGLFTLGLSRLREHAAGTPAPDGHSAPPPVTYAERQRLARDHADSGDLWAPVRTRLDEVAGPLPVEATSLFGPMFSAHHHQALADLFAAAGPDGAIAFTAWGPLGVVGRLLRLAALLDPAPAGHAAALAWGREERLRQDLELHADEPEFRLESLEMRFAGEEEALTRLCRALPPLAAVEDQDALRTQGAAIINELAVPDGDGITLPARYLIAIARRRSAVPGA